MKISNNLDEVKHIDNVTKNKETLCIYGKESNVVHAEVQQSMPNLQMNYNHLYGEDYNEDEFIGKSIDYCINSQTYYDSNLTKCAHKNIIYHRTKI